MSGVACGLNTDSRAALFTLTFPKDIHVPPEFPLLVTERNAGPSHDQRMLTMVVVVSPAGVIKHITGTLATCRY